MLDRRRRRWADVVQMVYKYFVFAGNTSCRATPGYHLKKYPRIWERESDEQRETFPNCAGFRLGHPGK